MKKYLYLLCAVFLIAGCGKKESINGGDVVVVPPISINKISLTPFDNSSWVQVAGGMSVIQHKLKDSKDSTVSIVKDSVDLKNIATYKKTLDKGTYDISVTSKNQSSAADTFMRISAVAKSYTVPSQQDPVFTETSTDGLITIGKSFIKAGTVPTFKTDTGTKTYKLGLINGFYYLYIKGGLQGAVSFTASAGGQAVVQKLALVSAKQQNMAVVTNSVNAISVVFTNFAYNQVAVNSQTLLTLNIEPDRMLDATSYFLATDENGVILNETKYIAGTTTFKMVFNIPFNKDRFNFYMIQISNRSDTKPGVVGFLQVKKGSIYQQAPGTLSPAITSPLTIHLQNASQFDKLNISTDESSNVITSPADAGKLVNFSYSNASKVWVQVQKNNTVMYNFFDISSGTHDFTVDLAQCTKPSMVQEITSPGTNLQVDIWGKNDVTPTYQYDHDWRYDLGGVSSQSNHLSYYYPAEPFKQYVSTMTYQLNDFGYFFINLNSSMPSTAGSFDATFNVSGTSIADFKPSFSGTFDYYGAFFENLASTPNFYIYVYSPSAANYTNVKFPDFSKYVSGVSPGNIKLKNFTLYQQDVYNESTFDYFGGYNIYYMNSKQVSKGY
jgi:hypothetical protein